MQSIFLVLVALGCLNMANSLQCYQCSNILESGCGDPFNANGLAAADKVTVSNNGVCVKTKLKNSGGSVVARLASEDATTCIGGKNKCKSGSQGGVDADVCCCTSDLCNGASSVQQHSVLLFAILSTMIIFVNRWL